MCAGTHDGKKENNYYGGKLPPGHVQHSMVYAEAFPKRQPFLTHVKGAVFINKPAPNGIGVAAKAGIVIAF